MKQLMNEVLIIQNISREGPGLLELVLVEENVTFTVVNLDVVKELPTLDGYKAIVVLGGPDSANDQTKKMFRELELIRKVLDGGVPYLGICLGLQTLVKAAGGQSILSEMKETGFINPDNKQHTVNLTKEGKTDPLMVELPSTLDVFQLHGETVELTSEMTLLATGKFCRNQIVKVGQCAYGIQSHFELTQEMLNVWAENDEDLIPLGKEKLIADFIAIEKSYTYIGKTLFRNFLKIAKLI